MNSYKHKHKILLIQLSYFCLRADCMCVFVLVIHLLDCFSRLSSALFSATAICGQFALVTQNVQWSHNERTEKKKESATGEKQKTVTTLVSSESESSWTKNADNVT